MYMKYLDWSDEKNEKLQQERNISFEEVQLAIEDGRLLTILQHHNLGRYAHKQIFVVTINS